MSAMPLTYSEYITPTKLRLVGTGAASDEVLASQSFVLDPWAAVERQIDELRKKNAELLAEEMLPPTQIAMQWISKLLSALRARQLDAPFRTIPNGEGGIVFEWINETRREMVRTIEVSAEGKIEVAEFVDNRLTSRRYLN